jgi:hypothetical protein
LLPHPTKDVALSINEYFWHVSMVLFMNLVDGWMSGDSFVTEDKFDIDHAHKHPETTDTRSTISTYRENALDSSLLFTTVPSVEKIYLPMTVFLVIAYTSSSSPPI